MKGLFLAFLLAGAAFVLGGAALRAETSAYDSSTSMPPCLNHTQPLACAQQAARAADRSLNDSYTKLVAVMKSMQLPVSSLHPAEAAWISMRDESCTFERRLHGEQPVGGISWSMCVGRLSYERSGRLQSFRARLKTGDLSRALPVDTETDAKLNGMYKSVRQAIAAKYRPLLDRAETAWILYRDRACSVEGEDCRTELEEDRYSWLQLQYPESGE